MDHTTNQIIMNPTPSQFSLITATAPVTVAIAGPGSGKTGTLIERYGQFLSLHHGTVIMTYTVAAAGELTARIKARGWPLPAFVGTLHSWCARLLMSHRPGLTILEEEQAERLRASAAADQRLPVGELNAVLRGVIQGGGRSNRQRQVLTWYRRKLAEINAEDFDTLLLSAFELIEANPPKVEHLMVDEYQDSSMMDHTIYSAIHTRMRFVVGDPDQAIFQFRGSSEVFLEEMADAPGVFTAYMEQNFRSSHIVCKLACHVLTAGTDRPARKATIPVRELVGSFARHEFPTQAEEILHIMEWARDTKGTTRAILCRYNDDVGRIRAALAQYALIPPADGLVGGRVASGELRETIRGLGKFPADHTEWSARTFWESARLSQAMRALLAEAPVTSPCELALWLREWQAEQTARFAAESITVCTVHAAKGLEWDHVLIAGADDSAFKLTDRRLVFVAVTRARDTLTVTSAAVRPAFMGASTPLTVKPTPFFR